MSNFTPVQTFGARIGIDLTGKMAVIVSGGGSPSAFIIQSKGNSIWLVVDVHAKTRKAPRVSSPASC